MQKDTAVIILAAGLGTRMQSDRAKVLHEVSGQPMILHVMATARRVAGGRIVVVVGHQADIVRRVVSQRFDTVFAVQTRQLGTGHAVACALPHLPPEARDVVILYGDVPLLKAATVQRFLEGHRRQGRDLSVLAVELDNPRGYGRLLLDASGEVCGIVEEADADPRQKAIRLTNTGIYCVGVGCLGEALSEVGADNAQGEFYLTDIVQVACRHGRRVGMVLHGDPEEVRGVNTRAELEAAELAMRKGSGFKT